MSTTSTFSPIDPQQSKMDLELSLRTEVEALGFSIVDVDFKKPWGGFFRLDDAQAPQFIEKFFKGIELPEFAHNAPMSPKFLLVEPGMKLSWQVHERRSEFWRVIQGPVGVSLSESDQQPTEPQQYQTDETISIPVGIRHRLIGLQTRGLVAEIWVHSDPGHFSDEQDIRRIEDDFGR